MTTGSVEPMRKLHARWGDRVHFVDVLVRQAHPGLGVPAYHSDAQKLEDARRYQAEDQIAWPVLVDDLAGTVHQVYGGLADPTYLLDADGRVAYYVMWTHAPNLNAAIEDLLAQGGRGVVRGGIDHVFHPWPPTTDGWRGISRGLPQSFDDMERAAPGSGRLLRTAHQLRPLLAPITLRIDPLPMPVRAALAVGAGAGAFAFAQSVRDSIGQAASKNARRRRVAAERDQALPPAFSRGDGEQAANDDVLVHTHMRDASAAR